MNQMLDMYSDDAISDPYTYYGRLRETEPVFWDDKYQTWVISRYEDIVWLLRRPENFSSRFYADDPQSPSPPIDPADTADLATISVFRSHEMIQNDRPDHTRLRSVLARYFTPGHVESWRVMIREVVNRLLDGLVGNGAFDVRSDLAAPLPLEVIAELMGVPRTDRPALKEHADRRMMSALSLEPNRMRIAATGIRDTSDYLNALLAERSPGEGSDLMAILTGAESDGVYTRDEVLANAQMLIDAGHETTIQLICNGLLALMRNPLQWSKLCAEPDAMVESAVEECLRFDPPLPAPRRLVAQDVTLGDQTLVRGQRVIFAIAAGNRDPRIFADPDLFDITRKPNKHIAFGSGMHVCLGQYLARLEGQELFRALAKRMPTLSLDTDDVEYSRVRGVRSLLSLPVRGTLL